VSGHGWRFRWVAINTNNPSTVSLHSRDDTVGGWLASVSATRYDTVDTVRCEWCSDKPCHLDCTCLGCVENEEFDPGGPSTVRRCTKD
jgi:hypothetical protein